MKKKAYLKTLEAVFALVLTFLFIMFVVPPRMVVAPKEPSIDFVGLLGQNPDFRNCIVAENYPCLHTAIDSLYPELNKTYEYRLNISSDPNSVIDLPQKEVYVDSVFIAGNVSYFNPKILRIYYWAR